MSLFASMTVERVISNLKATLPQSINSKITNYQINIEHKIYAHVVCLSLVLEIYLTCNSHLLFNSGFTFLAVSDHILMKDGLNGQYLEMAGSAKKLFGAQVVALDRRMYIT